MTFATFLRLLAGAAGLILGLGVDGCSLRATRDFGPQSSTTHESLDAGFNPVMPNVSREGAADSTGGAPTSTDTGTLGAAGMH